MRLPSHSAQAASTGMSARIIGPSGKSVVLQTPRVKAGLLCRGRSTGLIVLPGSGIWKESACFKGVTPVNSFQNCLQSYLS